MTTALNKPKPAVQDALSDCPNCWETPCACPTGDDGWVKILRAAFEIAARDKCYNLCRDSKHRDDYAFPAASGAWFGFQAGAQWKATRQATPLQDQNARFAIDGTIACGRAGTNKPPSDDHWLMEYWKIGAQLAKSDSQAAPSDLRAKIMALPLPDPHYLGGEAYGDVTKGFGTQDLRDLRHAAAELVAGAAQVQAVVAVPEVVASVKVCIGYVVKGEPLKLKDGEYALVPLAPRQPEKK